MTTRLYYLVEVESNAPPAQHEGVGRSVARAIHHEMGDNARVCQIEGDFNVRPNVRREISPDA